MENLDGILRDELKTFTLFMEARLRENEGKESLDLSWRQLLDHLRDQARDLEHNLVLLETAKGCEPEVLEAAAAGVARKTANVANYALFLFLNHAKVREVDLADTPIGLNLGVVGTEAIEKELERVKAGTFYRPGDLPRCPRMNKDLD